MMMRRCGLIVLAALLAPALAAAQAPPRGPAPVAPQPEHVDPKACGNSHATVGAGGLDVNKRPGTTLSDKLAQSNGVICPPAGVDPEIREPAPPTGNSMPVITPPGSPGGNPNVQPK